MNRGLYHRGFALQAGHTYAGYLYARVGVAGLQRERLYVVVGG